MAGERIMSVGNTGFSSAPHIHFAVILGGKGDTCEGGKFINPNRLFNGGMDEQAKNNSITVAGPTGSGTAGMWLAAWINIPGDGNRRRQNPGRTNS
jgi:murein DD-endopeptidase MepM/ murein hydrolase activator NlpD